MVKSANNKLHTRTCVMNYIGSKLSLLPFIEKGLWHILSKSSNSPLVFCDLFAGTGAVGTHFKKKGFSIIANDSQYYSYVLNKHFIENTQEFDGIGHYIDYLNNIEPRDDGFIFNHYCLLGKNNPFGRMYFSDNNGKFCDAVRIEIERLYFCNQINEQEYFYLLASLINSIDKYANTASVYGAYLKHLKKSAEQKVVIKGLDFVPNNNLNQKNKVYNLKAESLITQISGDILYLDPPYNSRQYCDNYHLLETIARYDNPEIKGKTGLRADNIFSKSQFCYKNKAYNELKNIIDNADFKYIVMSYNNEGIIALDKIEHLFATNGDYHCIKQEHKRFKSSTKTANQKSTIEYLHCLKKG